MYIDRTNPNEPRGRTLAPQISVTNQTENRRRGFWVQTWTIFVSHVDIPSILWSERSWNSGKMATVMGISAARRCSPPRTVRLPAGHGDNGWRRSPALLPAGHGDEWRMRSSRRSVLLPAGDGDDGRRRSRPKPSLLPVSHGDDVRRERRPKAHHRGRPDCSLDVHAAAAGLPEIEWRGMGRSSTGGDWRLAARVSSLWSSFCLTLALSWASLSLSYDYPQWLKSGPKRRWVPSAAAGG
jgi:hypothetical protein